MNDQQNMFGPNPDNITTLVASIVERYPAVAGNNRLLARLLLKESGMNWLFVNEEWVNQVVEMMVAFRSAVRRKEEILSR